MNIDSEPKIDAPVASSLAEGGSARYRLRDYVALARVDHWTKNLFILPGVFLALHVFDAPWNTVPLQLALAMAATCLVASANYTINEWLDREFDRFHPRKARRPSVRGNVRARGVWTQYVLLSVAGLAIAAATNVGVLVFSAVLLAMGLAYNVRPLRTKDRAYLDVVSESVNNPIRLCIGWLCIAPSFVLPPSSILFGYWCGGAFLMAAKRYAEFRTIGDPALAGRYRRSFQTYTEETLLASAVFHAMAASLFLGVFLLKYRIELILTFPLIAGLFSWYLRMSMKKDSAAQHPEKLLGEGKFMLYVLTVAVVMAVLFKVEIPFLHALLRKTFSEL